MKNPIAFLIFTAFFTPVYSQTTPVLNLPKDAKVEGTVSDMRTKTTEKQ